MIAILAEESVSYCSGLFFCDPSNTVVVKLSQWHYSISAHHRILSRGKGLHFVIY